MKIKILYNNADQNSSDHSKGWGFSALIGKNVIFDTAESVECLEASLRRQKIDLSMIKDVILSHDHWDHIGGLAHVIKKNKKVRIHICLGFDTDFRKNLLVLSSKVIKESRFNRIVSCVYTTGQLTAFYKNKVLAEQALILQTMKGFSVVTGCAHPGIINILKKIRSQLSVKELYAVIGGFHLDNYSKKDVEDIVNKFKKLNVKKVAPLHCTGREAIGIFQKIYQENCYQLKAGEQMEV